jgi:molecular chaperone GrpE
VKQGRSEKATPAPAAPPEPEEPPAPVVPLEQHQRLLAEFDNYRKRVERERQRLERLAVAEMMCRLLPVLDDLERAAAALRASEDGEIDREAILKILGRLAEACRREGIEQIEASPGTVFDPDVHEAVLTIPTAGVPEGSVAEVLQAGYCLGDRLLRPARVAVARAIEPNASAEDTDAG